MYVHGYGRDRALIVLAKAKMGSGGHRRWVLRKTNYKDYEDRHISSAECGEDRKWDLCSLLAIHPSVNTPCTHI